MAVEPGEILQGKYRLDELIGRGGMGQVFAATDLQTGAEVAVKVVTRLYVDDQIMIRLHREAAAAARIRSDYVPRVLEVAGTDERELFLVMERLHGTSLSQTIRERGALPWPEVEPIAEDVLRGLIDAHTAGIVHRDLKPSNVFLAEGGGRVRAFVLDFGVCKMDGVDHERLTATGESIGTVAYMAPEQIRGAAKVDDRADLYAFGALVFEMLTGRLPHEGPSQMAILASKLEKAPARLADHVLVEIPPGLDELVAKTLARDPQDRPASAQELLKAWRAISTGQAARSSPGIFDDERPSRRMAAAMPRDSQTTQVARPGQIGPTMVVSPSSAPKLRAAGSTPPPGSGPIGPTLRMSTSTPPPPPIFAAPRASAPPPFEAHATQTALTTAGVFADRRQRGARIAVVLAAIGMVTGIVVIGVSVARGPSKKAGPAATAAPAASPSTSAAEPEPQPEPESEPEADPASSVVDLPEDVPEPPAAAAPSGAPTISVHGARKRVRKTRPSHAAPHTTGATTGTQHITTQPRY